MDSLNNWLHKLCLWIGRHTVVEMSFLQADYRFSVIPISTQADFCGNCDTGSSRRWSAENHHGPQGSSVEEWGGPGWGLLGKKYPDLLVGWARQEPDWDLLQKHSNWDAEQRVRNNTRVQWHGLWERWRCNAWGEGGLPVRGRGQPGVPVEGWRTQSPSPAVDKSLPDGAWDPVKRWVGQYSC